MERNDVPRAQLFLVREEGNHADDRKFAKSCRRPPAMKILVKQQAILWCRQHKIALSDRDLPELSDCVSKFTIPEDAQKRVYLVSRGMQAFASEAPLLVWFDDWSVWPSGQRMHVFDRFRLSYGENRRLIDSPAHVFDQREIDDAISFVTLAVLFLWDCYVVTPGRSKLLFFSHDEYGLSKGVAVEAVDGGTYNHPGIH